MLYAGNICPEDPSASKAVMWPITGATGLVSNVPTARYVVCEGKNCDGLTKRKREREREKTIKVRVVMDGGKDIKRVETKNKKKWSVVESTRLFEDPLMYHFFLHTYKKNNKNMDADK
jgi:hypothetical protein